MHCATSGHNNNTISYEIGYYLALIGYHLVPIRGCRTESHPLIEITNLKKCTESPRFSNRCNFFDFESYKKSLKYEKTITILGETSKNKLLNPKFENPVNIPSYDGDFYSLFHVLFLYFYILRIYSS